MKLDMKMMGIAALKSVNNQRRYVQVFSAVGCVGFLFISADYGLAQLGVKSLRLVELQPVLVLSLALLWAVLFLVPLVVAARLK